MRLPTWIRRLIRARATRNAENGARIAPEAKDATLRMAGALQVRDLIRRLTRYRRELRDWRASVGQHVTDPRARFLLDFISGHESHIDACLDEYSSDRANGLLDTWIPYSVERSLLEAIAEREHVDSSMSIDEVIETTLRIDRALTDLYKRLATAPLLPPRVRELFGSLLELESNKERRVALAMLED